MGFMDSYKRLDNLCKDIFGSNEGVSSYIRWMEEANSPLRATVSWKDDYYALKKYRHIRNKIAHEVGATEQNMCSIADVEWVEGFYARIMNGDDPLAKHRRLTVQKKASKPEREYTPSVPQNEDRSDSRAGAFAGFAFVVVLAFILYLVHLFTK